MNILAPTSLDPRQLYKRSALQVGLLTFATLGLYLFVWSFFTLRSAKALLDDESEQPVWWSLGLLLPIFNLFAIFRLFDRVKTLALRAQLSVPAALGALGLVVIALNIVGRVAPDMITSMTILTFLPFAYSQLFVERAELVLSDHESLPVRFSWFEIVILVLGFLVFALAMVGYTIDENGHLREGCWFPWLMFGLSVASAFWIARESRLGLERILAGKDGPDLVPVATPAQ